MVSFALAAVLVASIAAKAVLRLAQREPRKPVELPALVVAPVLPVVPPPTVVSQPPVPLHPPASIGDASLAQLPASREGHVVHSDVTVIPSIDPKTSLRHARRHRPRSSPPPIQYDDEGLPIIH
jgi:hypothetical protein